MKQLLFVSSGTAPGTLGVVVLFTSALLFTSESCVVLPSVRTAVMLYRAAVIHSLLPLMCS